MDNNNIEINEDALYTLKVDANGFFYTDYVFIDKSLLEEVNIKSLLDTVKAKSLNELSANEKAKLNEIDKNELGDLTGYELEKVQLFFVKKQLIFEFFSYLYENHKEVYGYRNFCSKYALTSSYCQFRSVHSNKNLVVEDSSNNGIYIKGSESDSLHFFENFTNDFFHSFFIQNAYQLCKEDKNIKIYSHRNVGWNSYNYILNDILTIDIFTNFSYGYASYFAVTLVLLGIRIIPYSRLVLYQYANVAQILRYTREYRVEDKSWQYAIDFVRDASNDFLKNGKDSFIAEYMVKECEKLTQLLPEYLIVDEFNLLENLYGSYFDEKTNFKKVKIEGYLLTIFRAEKVSGAIEFYSSIQELSSLFSVEKYLHCINNCCFDILPQLNDAISKLDIFLQNTKKQISVEQKLLNKFELDYKKKKEVQDKYYNYELKFREELYEENKEVPNVYSVNSSLIVEQAKNKMVKSYPEYVKVKQNYDDSQKIFENQKNTCNELENQYHTHQNYRNKIDDFKSKIKAFIEDKKN